jgi:uncharacterized protein (UPF0248 family)
MWEYVDGKGLWKRYRNQETGEESIELHEPKVVKTWCPVHQFDDDIPRNRILTCNKCGQEVLYIAGYHELRDGKLIVRKH